MKVHTAFLNEKFKQRSFGIDNCNAIFEIFSRGTQKTLKHRISWIFNNNNHLLEWYIIVNYSYN